MTTSKLFTCQKQSQYCLHLSLLPELPQPLTDLFLLFLSTLNLQHRFQDWLSESEMCNGFPNIYNKQPNHFCNHQGLHGRCPQTQPIPVLPFTIMLLSRYVEQAKLVPDSGLLHFVFPPP